MCSRQKNGLAQSLSMKAADGSWAWAQQQLPGCVAAAHSGTLGDVQALWPGTNSSVVTAVQVL